MSVSSSPPLQHERRWLVLALALVLLFALPLISYPPAVDQGEFATLAEGLLRGQTLYTQIWNPKPPAAIFLYAAIFSVAGPNIVAVRVFDVIWLLLTCLLLYLLGRRMYHAEVGLVASFGYSAAYVGYDFGFMAEPDTFMVLPLVGAVYCLVRGRDGGGWRWLFLSGACLGLAFWFKYTSLLLGFALLVGLIWPAALRQRWGQKLIALIAGFSVVSLIFSAYLVFSGAWSEFLTSIAVTSGYTALGFGGSLDQAVARLVDGLLIFHIGLWLLALVTLVADLRASRTPAPDRELSLPDDLLLWVWLVMMLVALLVQQKLYPYQWVPMLAPLALLAGRGFVLVRAWVALLVAQPQFRSPLLAPVVLVFLCLALGLRAVREDLLIYPAFVAYESGTLDPRSYALNFGGDGSDAPGRSYLASSDVAAYIKAHTANNEPLVVWSFNPEIYFLADRPPLTRFIYSYPLVAPWYPPAWRDEFITTLRRTPPAYFVVLHDDYSPYFTGYSDDSASQLRYVPGLIQLLNSDYIIETQIGHYTLYRHR